MQVQGKGGYSSSQTGINIREDALGQGKLLVKSALSTLTQFINNINACNVVDDFIITAKNETTKEEAEVDKIYFEMGLKPTAEFFKKRGYEESEFTLTQEQPATNKLNQSFSQKDDNLLATSNAAKAHEIFTKQ